MSSSYSSLYWVLSHWAHFTVHRSVYVCVFCIYLFHTAYLSYCNMVRWTWWDWSLILRNLFFFSALTLLVGSFDPWKPLPDMNYNVFGGMLNLTQQRPEVCVVQGPIPLGWGPVSLDQSHYNLLHSFCNAYNKKIPAGLDLRGIRNCRKVVRQELVRLEPGNSVPPRSGPVLPPHSAYHLLCNVQRQSFAELASYEMQYSSRSMVA